MKLLDFKTDYFFPTPSRYLGYVISLIGIIGIFTKGIETIIICFAGLGLSFTRYGVLIDKENLKLKEYLEIFWFKKGNWKSMELYPYLSVLEISQKSSTYSQANVEYTSREMVFRITLLNKNHYEKITLKQLENKEKAHKEAEKIATDLKIKKVIYSPGN